MHNKYQANTLSKSFCALVPLTLLQIATCLQVRADLASDWIYVRQGAPHGLMQLMKKQLANPNSNVSINIERMRIRKIQSSSKIRPLYLIDTRTTLDSRKVQQDALCGAAGCNFLAYIPTSRSSYQKVLDIYLNPDLPPRTSLISTSSQTSFGLPCLSFSQLNGRQVEAIEWCFDGKEYQPTAPLKVLKQFEQ